MFCFVFSVFDIFKQISDAVKIIEGILFVYNVSCLCKNMKINSHDSHNWNTGTGYLASVGRSGSSLWVLVWGRSTKD